MYACLIIKSLYIYIYSYTWNLSVYTVARQQNLKSFKLQFKPTLRPLRYWHIHILNIYHQQTGVDALVEIWYTCTQHVISSGIYVYNHWMSKIYIQQNIQKSGHNCEFAITSWKGKDQKPKRQNTMNTMSSSKRNLRTLSKLTHPSGCSSRAWCGSGRRRL